MRRSDRLRLRIRSFSDRIPRCSEDKVVIHAADGMLRAILPPSARSCAKVQTGKSQVLLRTVRHGATALTHMDSPRITAIMRHLYRLLVG